MHLPYALVRARLRQEMADPVAAYGELFRHKLAPDVLARELHDLTDDGT